MGEKRGKIKSLSCNEVKYGSHHTQMPWWNGRSKEENEVDLRCSHKFSQYC